MFFTQKELDHLDQRDYADVTFKVDTVLDEMIKSAFKEIEEYASEYHVEPEEIYYVMKYHLNDGETADLWAAHMNIRHY